jgi:hypothetical protein
MEPTILYRCPGKHKGPNGKTYDFKGVDTLEVHEAMLEDGWHPTLTQAILDLPVTPKKARAKK